MNLNMNLCFEYQSEEIFIYVRLNKFSGLLLILDYVLYKLSFCGCSILSFTNVLWNSKTLWKYVFYNINFMFLQIIFLNEKSNSTWHVQNNDYTNVVKSIKNSITDQTKAQNTERRKISFSGKGIKNAVLYTPVFNKLMTMHE